MYDENVQMNNINVSVNAKQDKMKTEHVMKYTESLFSHHNLPFSIHKLQQLSL